MKRIFASIVALFVGLAQALGAWAIFQDQLSASLPAGVTLQPQDGGVNYFAGIGATSATASRTFAASAPGQTKTFTSGWDDPFFWPQGPFLTFLQSTGTFAVSNWLDAGYNTANTIAGPQSSSPNSQAVALSNGISVVVNGPEANLYNGGGPWGNETVGVYGFDEPQGYEMGIVQFIKGYPSATFTASAPGNNTVIITTTPSPSTVPILANLGFCASLPQAPSGAPWLDDGGVSIPTNTDCILYDTNGAVNGAPATYFLQGGASPSFASKTITQKAMPGFSAAQFDTRFFAVGFSIINLQFGLHSVFCPGDGVPNPCQNVGNSNRNMTDVMQRTMTSQSGRTRGIDVQGADLYWFVIANCQNVADSNCSQTMANAYDTSGGSSAMTYANAAKGSHYGDWLDMFRVFQAAPTGNNPYPQVIETIIEVTNCKCSVSYDVQPVEVNWALWSGIIHGSRGTFYFPQSDLASPGNCQVDSLFCTFAKTNQSVTFTGSASAGTLTVTTNPTNANAGLRGQLAPGMVCTSGCTGTVQVLQENTTNGYLMGTPATAVSATFSGTTMTVTSSTGAIPVPGLVWGGTSPTVPSSGLPGNGTRHANIVSGPLGQTSGTYTIDFAYAINPTCPCSVLVPPGSIGTYTYGGGGSASSGTLTFQQQAMGWGPFAPTPVASVSAIGANAYMNALTTSLAPILHSNFAKGFIATQSPDGYMWERHMAQPCGNLQSTACANGTGIETMVKYYQGSTYTAVTGDSITPGFYIFADTRNAETAGSTSATFTLCTACTSYTTADVIGESRSIGISARQFTDNFANAWTVHIYKVH